MLGDSSVDCFGQLRCLVAGMLDCLSVVVYFDGFCADAYLNDVLIVVCEFGLLCILCICVLCVTCNAGFGWFAWFAGTFAL